MTLLSVTSGWPHSPTLRNTFLSAAALQALCRRKLSTSRTCRPRATRLATYFQRDWFSTTCCSDTQFFRVRNITKSWARTGPVTLTSRTLSTSRSIRWHLICWKECYRRIHRKESPLRRPYSMGILVRWLRECKNRLSKKGRRSSKSHTTHICRAWSPRWSNRPRRWSTLIGPALASAATIRCIDSRRIGECIDRKDGGKNGKKIQENSLIEGLWFQLWS